jgi:hypothetical protein
MAFLLIVRSSAWAEHNKTRPSKKYPLVIITNKPFEEYEDVKSGKKQLPPWTLLICAQNFKLFFRVFATSNIYVKPGTGREVINPESMTRDQLRRELHNAGRPVNVRVHLLKFMLFRVRKRNLFNVFKA